MNNPFLLKKQLKDNEEELSSYLRDMKIWQDQMKRKEHSPLVKKSNEKKKSKTLHSPAKKISSWDYSAWDKFDVDKACEVLEEHEKSDSDSSSDDCTNNQSQSKLSEALYEKNLGNALVQKQKWAEAILRYTRAIEYYDKDPVFHANRALCYLKTKEFKSAISDCTSSLKLDNTYVKAYQRRSAAYISLGMYNEAKKDLNEVLKLEPNNKQAKLDTKLVNSKLQQTTTQITTHSDVLKTNQQSKDSSKMLCKDIEEPIKIVTQWPSRVDCNQITSIQKPPHQRSKKPFYVPKIKDVQVDQEKVESMNLLQTTLKEICEKNKQEKQLSKNKNSAEKKNLVETEKNDCVVVVPPPPQTYIQLKQDWAYLQSNSKLLFQYLKQIPGKQLPSIVRNSMDSDLFVDILRVLKLEFMKNGYEIVDYLIGISELPRLQMLVMFCSDNEISCIKELLNHVSKSLTEKNFINLKNSFGV